ncbi:hypothetical protein V495_05187 [Pseudogymnoascus sp. VKM F-4514 (FW-929)]|nr:hypothetical protein V490_03752 [Pseudogymnoascus sp. VKM F-3557]KFY40892.1 hypothetical protein V495_05187 [Pseudogymnoascus sp. VKM F-4514 (FW-929)]KFY60034.1 hypothetical protein V497_03923 [Pseudogymnoascus sp. VKM F-4516 (FW-969)]
MSTKRPAAPGSSAPKPPVSFSSSITISDIAVLIGTHPVLIRSYSVIQPRARLITTHGPVSIGSMCIISERASLGLLSVPTTDPKLPGVTIGDNVTVDIGAIVEASHVGDGTHIEANARVHAGAKIGKFCRIGAFCEVAAGEVLEDYTVLFGEGLRRIDKTENDEAKLKATRRHVEVLRKLVTSKPEKFM